MAKKKIITTITNGKFESTEKTENHTDDKGHFLRKEYKKATKLVSGEVFVPFSAVSSIETIESEEDTKE